MIHKHHLIYLFAFLYSFSGISQYQVAITIDDVPNTIEYKKNKYNSILLQELDSLAIPIAIFINEGLLLKNNEHTQNTVLLNNWANKEYITLGNHTYSHLRYSTTDFKEYTQDIIQGEKLTKEFAKKHSKSLKHFRFPYNDLGKDSIQHQNIKKFLNSRNYQITPFTIESSDWMFNAVYKYYLKKGDTLKATEIGELYVNKTLAYFTFFNQFTNEQYGRTIKHIYLCHDNILNTHYLPVLVKQLAKRNYDFISLDQALTDPIYQQKDYYYKKWGISWLYRWIPTHKERVQYMKTEPSLETLEKQYQETQN